MKLKLLFALSLFLTLSANAFHIASIDTLPPELQQYTPRQMIFTDSTTGDTERFKTGDYIIYYRKDRNKKYRKKIIEITENGFIATNQNVKLSNIAKVRHKNLRLKIMPRVVSSTVLGIGLGLLIASLVALFAIGGTVLATFVLTHYIALVIVGAILTTIGVFTFLKAFKKYTSYIDLEEKNSSAFIEKTSKMSK